jgi:hypothetical protein
MFNLPTHIHLIMARESLGIKVKFMIAFNTHFYIIKTVVGSLPLL